MIILHALWEAGRLHVWGEDSSGQPPLATQKPIDFSTLRPRKHTFACTSDALAAVLKVEPSSDTATIGLPSTSAGPQPSSTLRLFDRTTAQTKTARKLRLFPWTVPSLSFDPAAAVDLLIRLPRGERVATPDGDDVRVGDSLYFLATVVQFGLELVARGRVLPTLICVAGEYEARWRPVLTAEDTQRFHQLQLAIPTVCRASWRVLRNDPNGTPRIVRDLTEAVVDSAARQTSPTVRPRAKGRRALPPLAVWLDALTSDDAVVDVPGHEAEALAAEIDKWRAGALSASRNVRTCFRLSPPSDDMLEYNPDASWTLEVLLQSVRDPSLLVPASQVWADAGTSELMQDNDVPPAEVLLRDLGRAARLYLEIERLLEGSQPDVLELDTTLAAEFLQAAAPVLERAGFAIFLPSWWSSKRARLSARLKTKSKSSSSASSGLLGLNGIIDYQWEVALGDNKMTARELQRLVALKQPLVQVRGEWVLLNEIDLEAALTMVKDGKSGQAQMTAGDALRIGLGLQDAEIGLPVDDIEADGWLGELLSADDHRVEALKSPENFKAELRPYQLRGLSWLGFHDRLGLGACLADDMGLGKTAQLLALLAHERESRSGKKSQSASIGPTIVVCPMSLVGNWQREAERFTPNLRVHVHHGVGRMTGEDFVDAALDADLVITTYQLVARDRELLAQVDWHRVVLDEAQNVKNAEATQSRAVRALPSARRIALTGTPVENRLSELWSIIEFLNPGLLGTATAFRKTFSNPIERDQDDDAAERLRRLTGPFMLRRLKTDRSIITDLPEKLEIKTYCNLTREQASLYQAVVDDMLKRIDEAEGIQRKGLILSTMLRLKQVCNHPAQFLADGSRLARRSGKLERLEEIVDEVVTDRERVLVFTQFAEMGTMLRGHLQSRLGDEVAWLHGGVPKKKRDAMVERFQAGEGPSVFLLSLKAGGTGLTLTAANHVVHFDRWWNPAVENQATDRAFRIGQKRNVQIRKFVTVGTLEERIDQMIEQKKALAERIVGAGESWLTELSTAALRDVVALSSDAVGEG